MYLSYCIYQKNPTRSRLGYVYGKCSQLKYRVILHIYTLFIANKHFSTDPISRNESSGCCNEGPLQLLRLLLYYYYHTIRILQQLRLVLLLLLLSYTTLITYSHSIIYHELTLHSPYYYLCNSTSGIERSQLSTANLC